MCIVRKNNTKYLNKYLASQMFWFGMPETKRKHL